MIYILGQQHWSMILSQSNRLSKLKQLYGFIQPDKDVSLCKHIFTQNNTLTLMYSLVWFLANELHIIAKGSYCSIPTTAEYVLNQRNAGSSIMTIYMTNCDMFVFFSVYQQLRCTRYGDAPEFAHPSDRSPGVPTVLTCCRNHDDSNTTIVTATREVVLTHHYGTRPWEISLFSIQRHHLAARSSINAGHRTSCPCRLPTPGMPVGTGLWLVQHDHLTWSGRYLTLFDITYFTISPQMNVIPTSGRSNRIVVLSAHISTLTATSLYSCQVQSNIKYLCDIDNAYPCIHPTCPNMTQKKSCTYYHNELYISCRLGPNNVCNGICVIHSNSSVQIDSMIYIKDIWYNKLESVYIIYQDELYIISWLGSNTTCSETHVNFMYELMRMITMIPMIYLWINELVPLYICANDYLYMIERQQMNLMSHINFVNIPVGTEMVYTRFRKNNMYEVVQTKLLEPLWLISQWLVIVGTLETHESRYKI